MVYVPSSVNNAAHSFNFHSSINSASIYKKSTTSWRAKVISERPPSPYHRTRAVPYYIVSQQPASEVHLLRVRRLLLPFPVRYHSIHLPNYCDTLPHINPIPH